MNKAEFVYVTLIATSPERVWEALTTAEFTRQYWHSTRVYSEWEEGGDIVFMVDDEEGERVGCEGKLLKVDHPRELSYTWRFPGNPELADEAPSRVSFRLEPVAEHTKLTVVHDQFPAESKMLVMVSGGWPYVLAGLKTLLETGAAIDFSSLPGQAA
jgi:uncharacterized protein YndB with AHSA1/START domain